MRLHNLDYFRFSSAWGQLSVDECDIKVTLRPLTASLGPDTRATRAFGNEKE